ncbi:aminotransferase class V-fold PLP-dependent enzyme, partial [Halioglobus sp. HI00S01]|uniref:aminotransferase class V-fold PLP-dependent enzyme n=1 Tax=Halioglobus sp. HI00S01 TaxID=1822214 RepID=UPI000B173323
DAHGLITPEAVAAALREDTILVSIMHANNEIGTVNDIAGIGEVTRNAGDIVHGANLVVGVHDADQNSVSAQRRS